MEPLSNSSDDRRDSRGSSSWTGGRAIFGLFLFLLGGLLLLDRFGWVDANDWTHLWPLFPIAIGVIKVIQPRREGQRFVGALLIVIFGAILLRHWVEFPIRGDLIAPGVLLLVGIRLMLVPRRRRGLSLGSGGGSGDVWVEDDFDEGFGFGGEFAHL